MRHRLKGRKLGRTPSHRKAMFRNMACSLIRSVRVDDDAHSKPSVPGRIVTTLEKAKELRPFVEKLITMARKASVHAQRAEELGTSAKRGSSAWKTWRESEEWNRWNQAIAPALACRRRAFAMLRDPEAVDILFDELAQRFRDRDGGYTRVVRLPTPRLGDAGTRALIEFVGENDRVRSRRKAPVIVDDELAHSDRPAEEQHEEGLPTAGAEEDAASATEAEENAASEPASVDEQQETPEVRQQPENDSQA